MSGIQVSNSTPWSLHPLDRLVIKLAGLLDPYKVLEPHHSIFDIHVGSGTWGAGIGRRSRRYQPGVEVTELGEKSQRIRVVLTRGEFNEVRET